MCGKVVKLPRGGEPSWAYTTRPWTSPVLVDNLSDDCRDDGHQDEFETDGKRHS